MNTTNGFGLVHLRLVLVALMWAGTFVAGRSLSHDVAPSAAAFYRFAFASTALWGLMLAWRVPRPALSRRQMLHIAVLGFFGIFTYNLCFFEGLRHISASRASLIIALNPAMIALAAFLFAGEQPGRTRVLGIAGGVMGVVIIVLGRDPAALAGDTETWRGDLAILGCVGSWVTYTVYARNIIRDVGALPTVFYSVLAGTVLLGVFATASGSLALGYAPDDWFAIAYLGVLGSAVAYVWYYDGINRLGATRAGIFIALNPVFAVILGGLLLDERPNAEMLLGGGLAVLGVYLCNRPARPPPAA